MVGVFGAGVRQDAQSTLGQLNGLFADLSADFWEVIEDAYQSFDVDQAEDVRLDMLAKLRRLVRPSGELDGAFRLRITNQGQADVSTLQAINRLKALDGVTWATVRINDTDAADSLGQPAHSVAYAVVGGDDGAVATEVYNATVAGIHLYGNTNVEIVSGGFCQTSRFIRPTEVRVRVEIDVRYLGDACNCAPPTVGTISQAVADFFASDCQYKNGDTVKAARVRAEAARVSGIEVVGVRIARVSDLIVAEELPTTIFERPVILLPDVHVRYVV
ncbi:MAG: hypothetical protein M9939_26565 [Mesorhizobium sp.]|nr:hypothetical protein [Mesorhizobium sp.]MCO5164657.1 hypothetical protein [Mesorhizobium sp.]